MVDPISIMLLADTNSRARPEDKSRLEGEDVGDRTFLPALSLQDLVETRPVTPGTYSSLQGEGSRVDKVACRPNSPVTVASYHCWSNTLFSDHNLPLLDVVIHPSPGRRNPTRMPRAASHSRIAEHHVLRVALSPEREVDCKPAVAAHQPTQSQRTQELWLRCMQWVMSDGVQSYDRVRKLTFRAYRLRRRLPERTKATGAR